MLAGRLNLYLIIFHVCDYFACMCVCVPSVCPVPTEARITPLELELQTIVSYHVGAEAQIWVL